MGFKKIGKLVALASAFVIAASSLVFAGAVTISWTPNNPTPEGYKIFTRQEGETYDYFNEAWSGAGEIYVSKTGETRLKTTLELPEGEAYYFIMRAYEGVLESGDSQEVNYTVPSVGVQIPDGVTIEKVVIININ